jgi:hypothetical protein
LHSVIGHNPVTPPQDRYRFLYWRSPFAAAFSTW